MEQNKGPFFVRNEFGKCPEQMLCLKMYLLPIEANKPSGQWYRPLRNSVYIVLSTRFLIKVPSFLFYGRGKMKSAKEFKSIS